MRKIRLLHALSRLLLQGVLLAALAWAAMPVQAQEEPGRALVVDGSGVQALWPAVTLLHDPGARLDVHGAMTRRAEFRAHPGAAGNLGHTSDAVWLRVALQVPGSAPQQRVLRLDYASLNALEAHVVQAGVVLQTQRTGNLLPLVQRALPTRTQSVALTLPTGTSELYIRVHSLSSMVLPLTLHTRDSFTAVEAGSQLVLGMILGLALCMLLYTLSHWVSLRDRMFLDYAVLLSGNMAFYLGYFGIGALYLWGGLPWLSLWASLIAAYLTVAAGTGFIRAALRVRDVSVVTDRVLQAIGWAALAGALISATGLLPYGLVQRLAVVLGVAIMVVSVPVAWRRARRGDRAASFMLLGWFFYACGVLTTAALLFGRMNATTLVLYVYPVSSLVEMAAWMVVLGLRVQAINQTADRARVEGDALRKLALTDALTGLPNRRGLNEQLAALLPQATPGRMLGVYLLDLDGFKPVNDRHGHDVGDALLVAVGQRLQTQLRGTDVVARLGGDEFVVLAAGLPDEDVARQIGQKMLASFNQPFVVLGQHCEVGLTIGYALGPVDGVTADDLIKRADAAMYAGKNAGRRCLQRGGRSLVAA